jgi:hypothetical protein
MKIIALSSSDRSDAAKFERCRIPKNANPHRIPTVVDARCSIPLLPTIPSLEI